MDFLLASFYSSLFSLLPSFLVFDRMLVSFPQLVCLLIFCFLYTFGYISSNFVLFETVLVYMLN